MNNNETKRKPQCFQLPFPLINSCVPSVHLLFAFHHTPFSLAFIYTSVFINILCFPTLICPYYPSIQRSGILCIYYLYFNHIYASIVFSIFYRLQKQLFSLFCQNLYEKILIMYMYKVFFFFNHTHTFFSRKHTPTTPCKSHLSLHSASSESVIKNAMKSIAA